MNQPNNDSSHDDSSSAKGDQSPPRPIIKKMRWPFPIIWIVPIVAAALAGYYLYQHHKEQGAKITIQFDDGSGLAPGQTKVVVHGVQVGLVESVELSDDHRHAVAHVRLATSNRFLARAQSVFWTVRPELSLQGVRGLSTLMSGPFIEARPGGGEPTTKFNGLDQEPVINAPGFKVVLHADDVGQLSLDSPVTYRGIQVGVVQDIRLSDESDAANVTVYIWDPYKVLVRTNSVFWAAKGADIKGGIFSGIHLQLKSLRTLLSGAVAFATPDKSVGPIISSGAQFYLNPSSKDEWLKWKPKIHIVVPAPSASSKSPEASAAQDALPAPTHPR